MKAVIYISGIVGIIFTVLGLIGSINAAEGSDSVLLLGIALVVGLCIPLAIFNRYKQERRVKEIIEDNKYSGSTGNPGNGDSESKKKKNSSG